MPQRKRAVSKRDPEKTKASILEQATLCFAQDGFHGAGLNEICRKARANKRMIYHYFGNKDALYRAVHRKGWERLGTWFAQELVRNGATNARLPPLSQEELLLEAIRIFHDFISTNQIFVRLLMWDGLEGGRASRSLWKDIRGPIYRQIETLVQEGQRSGVLASDLQPSHLIISFMGAVSFYYSHAHTMVDIFQKDPLSPEAIQERKEQVVQLFKKLIQT